MGWKRNTLLAIGGIAVAGYATLAVVTREPDRPVVKLPVAGKLLVTHVTVVDPATGTRTPDVDVLMDAGRIVSVGPQPSVAAGTRIVDATGKFVVPGYNDMHAHPLGTDDPSGDLALMLANGVTGFRQMSGSDTMLDERRGSRLPLTQDSPALLAMPGALLTPLNASTPDRARAAVRSQQEAGADFIKIGLVDQPSLFAALDEARRVKLPVAGHVPAGTSVVVAAQRGMRAIEHLGPANGLTVACSSVADRLLAAARAANKVPKLPAFNSRIVDKLAEWALLKRIVNPAAADHESGGVSTIREAAATYDETRCRAAARALKAAGNWQVPTLIRLKTTLIGDDPSFARDPNLRFMPPGVVRNWREVAAKFATLYPPSDRAVLRQGYMADLRLVKLLDEEGVPMLAGSDASGAGWEVPGFALHQEFDELARAGLSPLRILQMTTIDAARFLGRTATLGSVSSGRDAELVILDSDPTKDVAALHRIVGVVRAGFYLDRNALAQLRQRVAAGQGFLK